MTTAESVRLLLSFWREVQPGARAASFGGLPGPAPSERIECPECAGKGHAGRFRLPCERCGGKREPPPAKGRNGRGWIVVDSYTGSDVGTVETGTVAQMRRVFCDGCGGSGMRGARRCRYCDGQGYVEIPQGRNERQPPRAKEDALDAALEACDSTGAASLWRAGSFSALDKALGELQPWARARVWRAYVTAETDPEPDLLAILASRVRQLERGRVRVPAELRRWQEERDRPRGTFYATAGERNAAMRAARAQGKSLAEVARLFGVSKATAGRVCQSTGNSPER